MVAVEKIGCGMLKTEKEQTAVISCLTNIDGFAIIRHRCMMVMCRIPEFEVQGHLHCGAACGDTTRGWIECYKRVSHSFFSPNIRFA